MFQFTQKISSKFIFIAIISLVIAVSLTGSLSYYLARSVLLKKLQQEDLIQLAELKVEKIENRLSKALDASIELASDPTVLEWLKGNELNYNLEILVKKKLDNIVKNFQYDSSFIASKSTKKYYKHDQSVIYLDDKNNDNKWFYNLLDTKEKLNVNINTDPKSGNVYVFINVLIENLKSIEGIAGVSLNFNQVTKEFTETDPQYEALVYLTDKTGTILITSNPNLLKQKIRDYLDVLWEDKILKTTRKATLHEREGKHGTIDMVTIQLRSRPWIVVYEVPRKNTTKALFTIAIGTVFVCFISVVLVFFIFYRGTYSIINPIHKLVTAFEKLKEGNISIRLNIQSNDEITLLAKAFNDFTNKIQEILQTVQENVYKLTDSSMELSQTTKTYSNNAHIQASAMEEISASVKQLNGSVQTVAQNTQEQFQNLSLLLDDFHRLSESITEMKKIIDKSKKQTSEISQTVKLGESALNSVNTSINSIVQSSKGITSIIEIIRDISEKINLLALNASIEAARAGESGKGFAVVAFEISKLADKTSESLKEIDNLVKKNQKEIEKGKTSIITLGNQTQAIAEGIEKIVSFMNEIHEFTQSQVEINTQVEKETQSVSLRAKQIQEIVKEEKIGFEEILKSIESIEQVVQSNTKNAEVISLNSENLANIAETLNEKIKFFKINEENK